MALSMFRYWLLLLSCLLWGTLGDNFLEESVHVLASDHGNSVESSARENATFLVLSRNSDVYGLARSIRSVEDRFNRRHGYDWVFLNDVPFDEEFINVTSSLVSGKAKYGLIPEEHWSYPSWIDQDRAAEVRKWAASEYIYGDSESYRHMCRFFSGFFFKHELLQEYKYYWRVEPEIELWCDIQYDPFQFMRTNDKKISFVISLYELPKTITTLWQTVKGFFRSHPHYLAKPNSKDFLSEDGGKTYNGCHFWSNFEIGSLDWFREQSYQDFFDYLDRAGGFFYERWGDAPVHTIAAGTLLNSSQIHFFEDIGYSHGPYTRCPTGASKRQQLKCHCNPAHNFDWFSNSCLPHWLAMHQLPYPEGYEEELPRVQAEECLVNECGDETQAEEQVGIVEDLRDIHELRKMLDEERTARLRRGMLSGSSPHDEL